MIQHDPPGRIQGNVVTQDGEPLAKASVRVMVDDVIVDAKRTNTRGRFNSRLLFKGTYNVEVESDEFFGREDGVEVNFDEVTKIHITVAEKTS